MLEAIPWGALVFGLSTLLAIAPIRRPRRLATLSWVLSAVPNEVPFVFLAIIVVSTAPVAGNELDSASASTGLAVTVLTAVGLLVIAWRARLARPVLASALAEGLGPDRGGAIPPERDGTLRRRMAWLRILLFPWPVRPHDVERIVDIPYGDKGEANLLDVYRHRSHPAPAPTLIHFHGGRFRWGRKSFESRPLLHHLARRGWTCISANYRVGRTPAAGYPEPLIDAKRVIRWARTEGREYGVDPDTIVVAGSSAGAHLAAMAALTANDPRFQPGFEAADTSIAAGIGLYGYYGQLADDEHPPTTTPVAYPARDAPAFFLIHGANDTYVPPAGARRLAEHLRAESHHPVVYAELPGAQHSFDLFHSIRFEWVIDAMDVFTDHVRSRSATAARPR
jgi:acetyl esterase/lipase